MFFDQKSRTALATIDQVDTTTILMKTFLITTIFATLHVCFCTVICEVMY